MKFVALSVLISFVVIEAAPQASNEAQMTNEFVTEDDIAKRTIADTMRTIESLVGDNKVAKAVVKSIDQKCMLDLYQKHKLLSDLTYLTALDFENVPETTKIDPLIVFANIAISCSNKLDGLLGFVIDNLFSYSGLLDTFREDEPFKKFIDGFTCYNKYAVEQNVLDPAEFSFLKYQLVNQTQEECDKEISDLREAASGTLEFGASFVVSDHAKCLQNELQNGAENFFLRYILLIPLGLSDEQKKAQKLNFIADARQGLEKILLCNIETKY